MVKRRVNRKTNITSSSQDRKPYLIWSIVIPVLLMLLVTVWHYRSGLIYYFSSLLNPSSTIEPGNSKYDARNVFLMTAHEENSVFGIDVSQYQSTIDWDKVGTINDRFPVDFVFIRATMGEKMKDQRFAENWKAVGKINKLRGAYHYFRPNENSIRQANNFIHTVSLKPGDLPPVLDIEERPRHQSMDSLRVGLKRWLDKVEGHYKIKPILYSGDRYFTDFLEREFKDYTLWIANYNFWIEKPKDHWNFWQFSEKGSVTGIKGFVDLNMFNGGIEDLENLCIPN